MKELSIEEKAKAYDEAIKRAQAKIEEAKVFDYDDEQTAHTIRLTTTDIFPELKESEDEKTRNSLLKYLKDMCKNTSTPFSLADAKLWIAWLEKQDEQNPQKNQNANIEWGIDFTTGEMHFNNLTLRQAEELRNALLGKQKPVDKVEPQVKELAETQHVKETCQENGNSLTQEPVSEDFEAVLAKEWQGYVDRGAATVDALEDNTQELAFAKGFYRGWNYPKSSVWHDANTLPSDPKAVIVEHNEYSTSICRAEQMSRVKGAKWAYIDDLLKL